MKRITALVLTLILCLSLAACRKAPEAGQSPRPIHTEAAGTEESEERRPETGTAARSGDPAETSAEPVWQSIELAGPWHLDSEQNDLAAFSDRFPGYAEWGASMEIRSSGQMSWYIGAEGWHGTYTLEGGVIHAQLTSDLEQSQRLWEFRIAAETETAALEMEYEGMTIHWVYGDQEEHANGTDYE